ncbi:MAG: hypothetical protein Q8L51_03405 [Candidatus Amesbacteria bacterium]|nr:hypothetical protein [Candidatus Amesbacteria bacterium]
MKAPNYLSDGGDYWKKFYYLLFPSLADVAVSTLISRLALFLVAISGTVFLVKMIMAGYAYLTSAGDQTKIQNATKEITNALIGLVIVVAAFFIVQILEVIYGVKLLS